MISSTEHNKFEKINHQNLACSLDNYFFASLSFPLSLLVIQLVILMFGSFIDFKHSFGNIGLALFFQLFNISTFLFIILYLGKEKEKPLSERINILQLGFKELMSEFNALKFIIYLVAIFSYCFFISQLVTTLFTYSTLLLGVDPQLFLQNQEQVNALSGSTNFGFWILSLISGCVLAPITEELLFRLAIFETLAAVSNKIFAALITALVFALVHQNFRHFLSLFVLGLILQYMRYRYKSLLLPIFLHAGFNFLAMILLLVAKFAKVL